MSVSASEPAPFPTFDNLRSLIRHLNESSELQKIALHRSLHDDLGGLIVSAGMDLAAVALNLEELDPRDPRLQRARKSIMAAVDLNRRLTEDLRPSLLDNFGLFAALRWHVKHGCAHSSATCSEHYPDMEMRFSPSATTGLYRIARDSLALVFSEPELRLVDLEVKVDENVLQMTLSHEHDAGEPIDLFSELPDFMHGLAERTRSLQGEMRVSHFEGGTALIHRFALESVTRRP